MTHATQHTPGQWKRESGILVTGPCESLPNGNRTLTICRTDNPYMGEQEQGANAAFICRACNNFEELLAALKDLYECGDHQAIKCCDEFVKCAYQKAKAAISKAESPADKDEHARCAYHAVTGQ